MDINNETLTKSIQPSNISINDISEFTSKQVLKIQKKLIELDKQGKLKEELINTYGNNLRKTNNLANYILEDFENRKYLFIEWTGIEVNKDKHSIINMNVRLNQISYGSNRYFLWKCNKCGYEFVAMPINMVNKGEGCQACSKQKNTCMEGKK